jgi:hypothetical protein
MLIDFSFSNFKSFRDEQAFSMQRVQRFVDGEDAYAGISTVAAIYGANASGKSNLLQAFAYMRGMVVTSYAHGNIDSRLPRAPFKLNAAQAEKPTEFFAEFIAVDGLRYQYWFSYDNANIQTEELRRFNKINGKASTRASLLFSREKQEITFGPSFRGGRAQVKETIKRRTNALVLSVCAAAGIDVTQPAFDFFANEVRYYQASEFSVEESRIIHELQTDSDYGRMLSRLVRYADFGIESVKAEQVDMTPALEQFKQAFPDTADSEMFKPLFENGIGLQLQFNHLGEDGTMTLPIDEESLGTRAALAFFSLALENLSAPTVAIIDEIDTSLHPTFVKEIVGLYTDPATNPHHAQLIFTTHDVALINTAPSEERTIQPDQIWFVEKSKQGASEIYPATDLGLRKEENIGKNYLNGVYGAVPKPTFHEAFARIMAKEVA